MSYLEESLSAGEEVRSVFRLHWIVYLRVALWLALAIATQDLSGWLTLFFVFVALGEWVKLRSIEQAVTNKRVILKVGLVSRKSEEMKLTSIETVEIRQSIFGRILGFGTVKVTGRGISDVVFKHINDPMVVKRAIESVTPET